MTSPLALAATRRDAARQALGLTSLGAGVIHLALGPQHMTEWVALGTGFYVSGTLQVLWGLTLLRTAGRRLLTVGALGSLLFITMWVVSRTTGLPIGPEAGQVESVGTADALCVGLEAVVLLGALVLLRRPTAGLVPAGRPTVAAVLSGVTLAVLATTGVAVAAPSHGHGAPCPASAVASGVDANHNGADDGVEYYFACQLLHEHDGGHVGYRPPKL